MRRDSNPFSANVGPLPLKPIVVDTISNTFALSGTNGPPNVGFRVLSSTNVGALLNTWGQVGTGTVAPNGRISFSGSLVPTESQRFYIIVSP